MLRIRLSGHLNIEAGDVLLRSRDFPGEQGRAAFAFLVGNRSGPVGRAALTEALWPGGPPPASDSAITSLISKLRSLLTPDPVNDNVTWTVACYQVGDLTPSAVRDFPEPAECWTR